MVNPIEQGYITVAERHAAFVKDYENGAVQTELVYANYDAARQAGLVIVSCSVWKDRGSRVKGEPPDGTGLASMPVPGPTNFTRNSEVENAETSALGRALAMIGYHAKESMASEDEVNSKSAGASKEEQAEAKGGATAAQKRKMFAMARDAGIDVGHQDGKTILQAIVLASTGKRSSKQLLQDDMEAVFSALEQSKKEYEATKAQEATDAEPVDF